MDRADRQRSSKPKQTESYDGLAALAAAVNITQQVSQTDGSTDITIEELEINPVVSLPVANIDVLVADVTEFLPQGSGEVSFSTVLEGTELPESPDNAETTTAWMPDLHTTASPKPEAVAFTRLDVESVEVKPPEGSVSSPDSPTLESVPAVTSVAPIQPESDGSVAFSGDADRDADKGAPSDSRDVTVPAIELAPTQVHSREAFAESVDLAPKTVTVRELFDGIVESAQYIHGNDTDTMTLNLKPAHLGRVEVQLVLSSQGSLSLKVSAEDQNVKGMLNSQIAQLVETLTVKGLRIESAEVVYSGVTGDSFGGQGSDTSHGGASEDSSRSRRSLRYSGMTDTPNLGYSVYWGEDEEATEFVA
jgi:hypothetical protein